MLDMDSSFQIDPREKAANQLLMRGHATVQEILLANYGEWPLRGLDIVADDHLSHVVSFVKYDEDSDKTEDSDTAAYVYSSGPRIIWFNRKFLTNSLNNKMAHERRHIQQFDDWVRPAEIYGKVFAEKFRPEKLITNRTSKRIGSETAKPGNFEDLSKQEKKILYYRKEIEIQARIEELLAAGYPEWPHMPQDRFELWAAMSNSGLHLPKEIRGTIPSFHEACDRFRPPIRKGDSQAAYGLNKALRSISMKEQMEFWRNTLPLMYGEILESFGDRLGRFHMRQGENKTLPLLLFGNDYQRLHDGNTAISISESITAKAKLLGVKQSAVFLARFTTLFQPSTQEPNSPSVRFMKAILKAPGVADELAILGQDYASIVTACKPDKPALALEELGAGLKGWQTMLQL